MSHSLRKWSDSRGFFSLATIFVAALALMGAVSSATAQFNFFTNNSAITITNYDGPGGNVVIPSTTNGFPVTTIDSGAFASKTAVTSIVVPDSVTNLGNSVFSGCQSLTNIILSTALTSLPDSTFINCTGLTNIVIPAGVTNLGMAVFGSCVSLTNVSLPDGLVAIGNNAFDSCASLLAINIPNSATNLGGGLFVSCHKLRSATIPDTLSTIPTATFYFCTNLTTVNIPSTVTSIEDAAFQSCTRLTNAVIPAGVTNIGSLAFNSCEALTNFFIPSGVTTIAGGAFADCTNLVAIAVDPGNASFKIVNGVLFNISQTTLIQFPPLIGGSYSIPDGVTNSLYGAFQGCRLTTVAIPSGVLNVGPAAFANAPQLAAVYFLGDSPFENGSEFLSDTNGVFYLNGTAGWGATFGGLPTSVYVQPGFDYVDNNGAITITGYTGASTTATIPNTILGVPVVSIGTNAFLNSPITNVIIPTNVINLGSHAFASSALTHITVPASVTTIGPNAFQDCTNLAAIYFNGSPPSPNDDSSVFLGDSTVAYYLPGATGWGSTFDGIPATMLGAADAHITSPTMAGGHFGFTITGSENSVIVVEAATNLASLLWQPLSTNTIPSSGSTNFTDLQSSTSPRRFYRLRFP